MMPQAKTDLREADVLWAQWGEEPTYNRCQRGSLISACGIDFRQHYRPTVRVQEEPPHARDRCGYCSLLALVG